MKYKCSDCGKVEEFKHDYDAKKGGWIILRQGPVVKDLFYCQSCKHI